MEFEVVDEVRGSGYICATSKRAMAVISALANGKLLTIEALSKRLNVARSTVSQLHRDIPHVTCLQKVNGRHMRLFGNAKTVAALLREDQKCQAK